LHKFIKCFYCFCHKIPTIALQLEHKLTTMIYMPDKFIENNVTFYMFILIKLDTLKPYIPCKHITLHTPLLSENKF